MSQAHRVDLVALMAAVVWGSMLPNIDGVQAGPALLSLIVVAMLPAILNHSALQPYAVDAAWVGPTAIYGILLLVASANEWERIAPFGVLLLAGVYFLKAGGIEYQWSAIGGVVWLPVSLILNANTTLNSVVLLPLALYGGIIVLQWLQNTGSVTLPTESSDQTREPMPVLTFLSDLVHDLNASADTIHAITTQQSGRAELQSTAVETMREVLNDLKELMQKTSDRATQLTEASRQAAIVSIGGQQVIETTLAGIRDTQQSVKAVGHTIAQLALNLRRIGEIISSVSDIATQSNFLALNAQIEAARAGEQGRGFTVVADEVRDMADQSRHATDDVRRILKDIQQAVLSAVDVTEGGAVAVETSLQKAEEVGQIIGQLHRTIDESYQASETILEAAAHQLEEMGRLGEAMQNMDQVAMQNQASSRMAESVSQNISRLSNELLTAVGDTR